MENMENNWTAEITDIEADIARAAFRADPNTALIAVTTIALLWGASLRSAQQPRVSIAAALSDAATRAWPIPVPEQVWRLARASAHQGYDRAQQRGV